MKSICILFIGLIMQCHGQHLGCEDVPPEPHCTSLYENIIKLQVERRTENNSEYLQLEHYFQQFMNITELLLGPSPSLLGPGEAVFQYFHNIILVSNNSQVIHLTKNVCRLVVSIGGVAEALMIYNSTNCTFPLDSFAWFSSEQANTATINSGVVECIQLSNILQDVKVHNALHCDAWKSQEKIENGDVAPLIT